MWTHLLPHHLVAVLLVTATPLTALSPAGVVQRTAAQLPELNAWLKRELLSFEKVEVREISGNNWGLAATRDLRAGDVAFEIPLSACVTAETDALAAAEARLGEEFPALCGDASLLALQLLLKEQSAWKDCATAAPLPMLSELGDEAFSSRAFEAMRANAEDDFAWLAKAEVLPSDCSLDAYREWVAVALSRSFVVGTGELVVAPGLDFVNHDDLFDPLTQDATSCVLSKKLFGGKAKLQVECPEDVASGQEFRLSYGALPAAAYLETYGFLPLRGAARRNAATCELRFELDPNDRFLDDKRDLLEENFTGLFMDDGLQIPVGGEPDPEYLRFARLKHLGGTDSFLLEPIFSREVWDFLGLPVSEDNERAALEALKAECQATKASLLSGGKKSSSSDGGGGSADLTAAPFFKLLTQVRQVEVAALDATVGWVDVDMNALQSKEYYQERRLKDLGLDTEWCAEDAQWSGSRVPGGVDW